MKCKSVLKGDRNGRIRRRGTARLFVLGAAFVASTGVGGAFAPTAYAQQPVARPTQSRQPAARVRFDIPAGRLADVLEQYKAASGVTVTLAKADLAELPSPGVRGQLTAAQALDELLMGTGVGFTFTAQDAALVDLRTSEFVAVNGIGPRVSSTKFTEPLRDIPQTINVISQDVIQQQNATTLRDVLRNVVGITFQAGEGGTPAGDQLTIRGFSARTDMFIDGIRDFGGYSRDSFNLEQVEVAKGPSSSIAGRGSTGGAINQVSKAPHVGQSFDVSLGGGNADYRRGTADFNIPVNDNIGFRVNAMWTDAGVPGRDLVSSERFGIAPSIAFGLQSATRLTLSHNHLGQDNMPEYGIPWVPANTNPALQAYQNNRPPVDSSNFYGLTTRDYEKTTTDVTTAQLDHRISPTLSLRNITRYGRNDRDSVITAPRFAAVNDSFVINRQLQSRDMVDSIAANQTSMVANVSTGALRHAVTAGVEFTHETSENFARTGPTAPTTDLFNPDPNQPYAGPITRSGASTKGNANTVAAYIFDTVQLSPKFELTGGGRWDRFDVDTNAVAVGGVATPFSRLDNLSSWRAGAVYKPQLNGSFYVGYGTSANPSAEGLALSAATVALDPEKTRNFELGTKWDVGGSRLSTSAAYFRTLKTNARTPGVNQGDPPTVLAGQQLVQGVELGASGQITDRWSVFSGYAFMTSNIEASNTQAELNNALALIPEHTLSLWSTYNLPRNIAIGGGAQYMDAVFRNATNTAAVPSYWLLNGLASYGVNEHLTLRLNGQNLNNASYVDRVGGGHYIPGPRRQIMLSTDIRF